jgi:hypothetical protein
VSLGLPDTDRVGSADELAAAGARDRGVVQDQAELLEEHP